MGKKGKGKKGSGSGEPQASGTSTDQTQQTQQPEQSPVQPPQQQPPPQTEQTQQVKGKKGKQKLPAPEQVPTPVQPQPAAEIPPSGTQQSVQGPARKRGKHQQPQASSVVEPLTSHVTQIQISSESQPSQGSWRREQQERSAAQSSVQEVESQGRAKGKQPQVQPPSTQAPSSVEVPPLQGAWAKGRKQQQPQPEQRQQPTPAPSSPEKISAFPPTLEKGAGRGRGRGRGSSGPAAEQLPVGRESSGQARGRGRAGAQSEQGQKDQARGPLRMPSVRQGPAEAQKQSSAKEATEFARGEPAPKQKWELEIPRRKNLRQGGTAGQPLMVLTNHLPLNIDPKLETAIHYDVSITPDKPKRMMRVVWEQFCKKYLGKIPIAFDDVKNAYTPSNRCIEGGDISGQVEIADPENVNANKKTYVVVVKYAAEVNLRALFSYMASGCITAVPQDALQCIDIVLRNASALLYTRVGRSYFSEPHGKIISLGDGLELWYGYFQSAVIGWKPFLNVDVAHKGFPKAQSVVDLIAELSSHRDYADDCEKISKMLKGLKIQYEIPNQPSSIRTYRANKLVEPPATAMFVQDGRQISVLEYFETQKNYRIRHRHLPCLWVGARERKIYLPVELCTILPGQVTNRKLNDIQTSNMVRSAATDAPTRQRRIMECVKPDRYAKDPVIQAFGLKVGTEFEKIRARLLVPPDLEYQRNRVVSPAKGTWRASEFLQPESLPEGSWAILNLDVRRTPDNSIQNFVNLLQQGARQLGMAIGTPELPFHKMDRFHERTYEEILRKNIRKKLLFVIVPEFPTNIYSKVKQKAELVVGCLTQCIKSKTIYKMNTSTVGNILLKVNAKLNGRNHTISNKFRPDCLRTPCMIMGADVTHPSPDQKDIPSVAAVTASYDPRAFQYIFSWRLQPAKKEIIEDLERIVVEQLKHFYEKTKKRPERIIFFRDGVSEGQFQEVMNVEVSAIRRACSSLGDGSFKPQITFLVVQKRHHTRFFPIDRRETEDRNMNVRAGTVVDTEITHPTDLEYYLVSHASIQGVARPTKYRILWDDSCMTEDDLEKLTYYLCHMFARCTRSVSYPAPTYYAHLAAARARVYLEGRPPINMDDLQRAEREIIIKNEILRGLPMFFV